MAAELAPQKKCRMCKSWKPQGQFLASRSSQDGLASRCQRCMDLIHEDQVQSQNDQLLYQSEQDRKKEVQRARALAARIKRSPYRTLSLVYEKLFVSQGGVCAICKQPETRHLRGTIHRLHIDQHPRTGIVRGLICYRCNLMLGHVKNDSDILMGAILYLHQNQSGSSSRSKI